MGKIGSPRSVGTETVGIRLSRTHRSARSLWTPMFSRSCGMRVWFSSDLIYQAGWTLRAVAWFFRALFPKRNDFLDKYEDWHPYLNTRQSHSHCLWLAQTCLWIHDYLSSAPTQVTKLFSITSQDSSGVLQSASELRRLPLNRSSRDLHVRVKEWDRVAKNMGVKTCPKCMCETMFKMCAWKTSPKHRCALKYLTCGVKTCA